MKAQGRPWTFPRTINNFSVILVPMPKDNFVGHSELPDAMFALVIIHRNLDEALPNEVRVVAASGRSLQDVKSCCSTTKKYEIMSKAVQPHLREPTPL